MKIVAYLSLPFLLVCANYRFIENFHEEKNTSLSLAIKVLIENLADVSNCVDIRIYGTNHGFPELKEILSANHKVPVEVKRFSQKDEIDHPINESAIMLIERVHFWNISYSQNLKRDHPKPLKFFVYLRGMTAEDLQQIAKTDKNNRRERKETSALLPNNEMNSILHLQYFIIDMESLFKLYTFVWYTPEKCSDPQLVEVNSFDRNSNMWMNSEFDIQKFHNFHGCTLVLGLDDSNPAHLHGGYLVNFINDLKINLNFTIVVNYMQHRKHLDKNLTVDLHVVQFPMTILTGYHFTRPYFFFPKKLIVSPGDPYTAYEKLLLPFDEQTWFLIGLFFITAFSTVFFFNFANQAVRNFIFGKNVATPSLNIVMIFCGISQTVLPKRNFARFLLTLYVLYSLVIRTAWQSKLFEFLQKDMRKPEIKSFEEMIEKNFAFYVDGSYRILHNESDLSR